MRKRGMSTTDAVWLLVGMVAVAVIVIVGYNYYGELEEEDIPGNVTNMTNQTVEDSCILTNAIWGADYVFIDEEVTLTVFGEDCDGEDLRVEIFDSSDELVNEVEGIQLENGIAIMEWEAGSEWEGGIYLLLIPILTIYVMGTYRVRTMRHYEMFFLIVTIIVIVGLLLAFSSRVQYQPVVEETYYFTAVLESNSSMFVQSPELDVGEQVIPESCGNEVVDEGEECDDGNSDNNDECLNSCLLASCGDGLVWDGEEECDDGDSDNSDQCLNSCQLASCGDGILWQGQEECDDGNDVNSDECTNSCEVAICGDGIVQQGVEECDDGNDIDTDLCTNSCTIDTSNPTPLCSDGIDNDNDLLTDGQDPGCQDPDDDDEGDESGGHNFDYFFEQDGFLFSLNWTNETGDTKRVVWDEKGRFGPAWRRHYLHSRTVATPIDGWSYELEDGTIVEESHDEITYQLVSLGDDEVTITAESASILITDHLRFHGDTIYMISEVENLLSEQMTVNIPVWLGALQVGNIDENGINLEDTDLSRMRTRGGGYIETDFSAPSFIKTKYPEHIDAFSPLSAMWDSEALTIGSQYLTEIQLPDVVEHAERPDARWTPVMYSGFSIALGPGETEEIVLAVKIDDADKWQSVLQPYRKWFNSHYGDTPEYCPTGATGRGHAKNQADPTQFNPGPYKGNGVPHPRHNPDYDWYRWYPGSSVDALFVDSGILDNVGEVEMDYYGIWALPLFPGFLNQSCYESETCYPMCAGTCMEDIDYCGCSYDDSACINECVTDNCPQCDPGCRELVCEFSANPEIFDPLLDIGADPQELDAFSQEFSDVGTDLYIYTRTCANIYDAGVVFEQDGSYSFDEGPFYEPIDLRIQEVHDTQLEKFQWFVDHGVEDFYIDYLSCPGEDQLIASIHEYVESTTGEEPFILREGSRDRDALNRVQLPLLLNPEYNPGHSQLINYLVPEGTYYAGKINGHLTDEQIQEVLDMGYQPVIGAMKNAANIPLWQDWVCQAYQNQLERWQSYGQGIESCEMPSAPTYCDGL